MDASAVVESRGAVESRASIRYFSGESVIRDGCYFFLPSTWLRQWRYWMQISPTEDLSEQLRSAVYNEIRKVPRLQRCPHRGFVMPGFMYRFLLLYTSVPLQVCMSSRSHR